ncbi:hypothetical protein ISN44_As08g034530 [Arabidopsis suecica]|uniref:Uncharacterized protein n=1 Tax=Arabidopsis suecica TaxID=45249 RepID=A0A8T2BB06_ARASU|nr:hypothetical protein ISN44_As08g034530 [Arabidopsis suecica]
MMSRQRARAHNHSFTGDGKDINLEKHPRSVLQKQCIRYLGLMAREAYEMIVKDGRLIYKQGVTLINSTEEAKSIFVLRKRNSLNKRRRQKLETSRLNYHQRLMTVMRKK